MTTTNKDFRVKNGLIVEGNSATVNGNQVITSADAANFALLNAANTFTGGVQQITTASAATKGLIIQGAASQTANLQEWQDSAGTMLANVDYRGYIYSSPGFLGGGSAQLYTNNGSWLIVSPGATKNGLIIRGAASQTADLQQWQNSAGTILTRVSSGGAVVTSGVGVFGSQSNTPNAQLYVLANSITNPTLVAKAIASQTANLTEWQDSSGGALSYVGPTGVLTLNNGNLTPPATYSLIVKRTSFFDTGDAASVGIIVRARASQTANLTEWQNSAGTALAAVSSAGTVRAGIFANLTGSLTYIQTNFDTSGIGVVVSSAAQKGLIVRGAASQTANLQEWQNSAGTALAKVDASGVVTATNGFITSASYKLANGIISLGYTNTYTTTIGVVAGTPTNETTLIVKKKDSTETGNLQEWQNSAGTVLAKIQSNGVIDTSQYLNMSTSGNAGIAVGGSYRIRMTGGNTRVQSGSGIVTTLTVEGVASQTANLQEWQISDGTVRARINSDGHIIGSTRSAFGTSAIISGVVVAAVADASTAIPLVVKGATSQTANLQEWQTSDGTIQLRMTSIGKLFSNYLSSSYGILTGGATYAGGYNFISNPTFATTDVSLIVKAVSSQTSDLQQWQNSAGTVLARVYSSGAAEFVQGGVAITGGSALLVSNNIYSVYGKIQTGNGVNTPPAQLTTFASSAATIGLVVRGTTSQTANLQEWQNSSGTVITRVRPDGQIGVGSTLITSTNFFVNNTFSTTHVVATIRGAVSQTANLTEWQDSAGIVKAKINSFGDLTAPALIATYSTSIVSGGVSIVPLTVKGFASQTANLTEWQDSAGVVLATVSNGGTIKSGAFASPTDLGSYINFNSTSGAMLVGTRAASNVGVIVRGEASQSASLMEWQNSAGSVLAFISTIGGFGSGATVRGSAGGIFGGATQLSSAGLTVYAPAAATIGAIIQGAASQTANLQEWQDSTGAINASLTSTGDFRIANIYAISSFNNAQLNMLSTGARITTNVAANVTLTVKGAASQTADLQQWQDSAGTVLTRINSAGNVYTSGYLTAGVQSPTGTLTVVSKGVSVPVAVIKGAASQTANLTEWQDSSGTILSAVDKAGNLTKGDGDQLVLAGQIYG